MLGLTILAAALLLTRLSVITVVAGAAGNIEGLSKAGTKPAYTQFVDDTHFGYATFSFKDRTQLQVDFIRSSDGSVLDSSTLVKTHDTQFVRQTVAPKRKRRLLW